MASAPTAKGLELERLRVEADREQIEALGSESMLWLAVVPRWDARLADRAGFPVGREGLAEFVSRAESAGLCESSEAPGTDGQPVLNFWMPESGRRRVLGQWPPAERHKLAEQVLAQVQSAVGHDAETAPDIAAWLGVARGAVGSGPDAGEKLNEEIQNLAAAGQTGQALDLIDAATSLASVLGGELESVAARGARRVSLEYRQRHNERALRTFIARGDQIDAFDRLLAGRDGAWALHYVGLGGIGKTMLVRYLTTAFATDRGRLPFPVARIDFDHVNPLYPGERPGQLLLEIADELAAHAASRRQDRLLGNLVERVTRLHELSSGPISSATVESRAFATAIDGFARFVETLDAPVVLFFDTCEELAKLHPPGEEAPGITATFEMLERLHDLVPEVRVVFAGRRLLASSGLHWTADKHLGGAVSAHLRPYLAIHEIRGFTAAEADAYLADKRGQTLPAGLRAALLERAVETGRVSELRLPQADDRAPRYNPFDLALYADLLDERRDLDELTIRGGDDLYVRLRIIERLRAVPGLLEGLALAVLLRRFDLTMLTAGLGAPGDELFERLAEQEWTQETYDHELDATFLEIQPRVLERLTAHLQGTDAARLRRLATEAAPRLRDLVDERALRELRVAHLDAALRLLDSGDAARMWSAVAQRIADEAAWPWARSVCERMLAEQPAPTVEAGLRASLVGALLHGRPGFEPLAYWRAIEAAADRYADPEHADDLADRAALGKLARELIGDPRLSDAARAILIRCLQQRRPAVAGALASAIASILDYTSLQLPGRAVELWAATLPFAQPDLAAFALALSARVFAREGRFDAAREGFRLATEQATGAGGDQVWNDWVAPDDLAARIQHEHVRIRPARPAVAELEEWLDQTMTDLDTIDGERLASALLAAGLEHAPQDPDLLGDLEQHDSFALGRLPACAAHAATPPLFATVAQGWLVAGEGAQALALLARRMSEAQGSRADPATVTAAQLGSVAAARRLRLADHLVDRLAGLAIDDGAPETRELARAAREAQALLVGPAGGRQRLESPPRRAADADFSELDAADVVLDRCERRLGEPAVAEIGKPRKIDGPALEAMLDDEELRQVRDAWEAARDAETRGVPVTDPSRWMRIALRGEALAPSPRAGWDDVLRRLQRPPRLAAQLALEEGELLALRLPGPAAELLDAASSWFEKAHDSVGAGMAAILGATALVGDRRPDRARERLQGHHDALNRLADVISNEPAAWSGWVEALRWAESFPSEQPAPGAASAAGAMPAASAVPLSSEASETPYILLGLFVILVLVSALGWLLRLAVRWLEPAADPGDLLAVAIVIGFTVLGFAVASSVAPVRRRMLYSLFELNLELESAETEPAAAEPVGPMQAAVNARLCARRPLSPVTERVAIIVSTSRRALALRGGVRAAFTVDPGGEQWTLSGPAAGPLTALARGARSSHMHAALRVPAALDGGPWERVIGGLDGLPDSRTFAPRRIVSAKRAVARDREPAPAGDPRRRIQVIASDAWVPLAVSMWQSHENAVTDATGTAGAGPTAEVLHLIGSPAFTFTSGEWQLRIDTRSAAAELESAIDGPPGVGQAQLLLSAERLPNAPRTLVIVQDEPGGVADDLERASGLRTFAAAVVRCTGVPALALPTLPPWLATLVLGSHTLAIEDLTEGRLRAAATAIRDRIALSSADTAGADRLPFDVTLIVPDFGPRSNDDSTRQRKG